MITNQAMTMCQYVAMTNRIIIMYGNSNDNINVTNGSQPTNNNVTNHVVT